MRVLIKIQPVILREGRSVIEAVNLRIPILRLPLGRSTVLLRVVIYLRSGAKAVVGSDPTLKMSVTGKHIRTGTTAAYHG